MTYKKIPKKAMKDFLTFLIWTGAFEGDQSYPSHVYVSKEDYKKLQVATKNQVKKQSSWATERYISIAVGYENLQYGPNQALQDAIRPGYVLIDDEQIKLDIQNQQCDPNRR